MSTRPQSKKAGTHAKGAVQKSAAKNKDKLKSDRQNNMAGKPGAQKDQFGSGHNNDEIKTQQRVAGRPGGKSDLAFRESPQDTQRNRGAKNKEPGRRRAAKKVGATKAGAKKR